MKKRLKPRRLLGGGDADVTRIPKAPWVFRLRPPEEMSIGGDAPKDFLELASSRDLDHCYIAKGPKRSSDGRGTVHGPKECITEALISSVGKLLPVKLADFCLLRLDEGDPPDVRFMSRYFLGPADHLLHGDELVAIWLDADESEIRATFAKTKDDERNFYTVDFLLEVLAEVCLEHELHSVRDGLGRMIGFDALIGANDRHPRNWGLIARGYHVGAPMRFAPIFDTARGLFWNHTDRRLLRRINDRGRHGWIRHYAEHSKPLISCRHHRQRSAVNHFDLVRYVLAHEADLGLRKALTSVIRAYSASRTEACLRREYGRMLSDFRLSLIVDLLNHRHATLMDIINA